jgi:hypothetical protein
MNSSIVPLGSCLRMRDLRGLDPIPGDTPLPGDDLRPAPGNGGLLQPSEPEARRFRRRQDRVLLTGTSCNRLEGGLACRLRCAALGQLGDLPLGVFFARHRDRADWVALEVLQQTGQILTHRLRRA